MLARAITCCIAGATLLCLAGCSTVYMKATPFYTGEYEKTEGPAEKRVNVWPLLYYRTPALSVLWPLVEVTDDHVAAHPLVAVYKLDKEEHQWRFLWPLAQFDFDTDNYHIFPAFWGDDYVVVFPEVWWFEKTKGVFPVFWWPSGFTVFPVGWYERDKFCHLFPLWLHSRGSGGHDTWVLWPIVRLKRNDDGRGFHAWPLIGSYEAEESTYEFAMWPLCHSWHKGDDSLVLTPLWSSGTKGDAQWNLLFPLYYSSVNPLEDEERFLTLVVGRMRAGEKRRWILVPIASSVAWGEDEKDIWMLGPIAHFRWGGDNVKNHVLPLWYYDRNDRLFLSPAISWGTDDDEGFVNLLTLLAHYSYAHDGRRTLAVVPPLAVVSWGGKYNSASVFPLFSWRVSRDSEEQAGGKKTYYVRIAPWFYFERGFGERGWSEDPDGTKWTGEWYRNGCFPLWHYQSHQNANAQRRYRDFSLLGLLYDYRLRQGRPAREDPEKTEDYVRSRILWRLFHYERIDEDKSVDLFPAITWDSKADGYRQFSFMWRLFRTERTEDGGRNLDLFFVPLMRHGGASVSRSE